MIVADRKKVPEIRDMIKKHKRVLLVGCGTCVTVCLAGGERETGILGSALRMALKLDGHGGVVVDECTIERQCEDAFIDPLALRAEGYDAICSLGCGAGVQALAERFPNIPVYPGLNTQFIGILESQGVWTEKCAGCGSCRLGQFAGICPITRCAKRLLNGPCGGSRDGKCEVNENLECAWQLIYDRAKALGILDTFEELAAPQDWSASLDGGPRKVVREDQCIAGLGPKA
ncbi:MAG TPA: methylenetetrahydrofolate reductase C-terminal domain-containing protein [Candidatus Hydrogenedentes bacterium]|nr:methylenetetrahydrofolate reductase C-terminal domain-containing protein [Candidatus Hydrogenedentota bacterium]